MDKIVPVGLIRPKAPSLENVEIRATLEKAVDDANLNVSERMALNKKFFPNGNGFPLLKKNATQAEFTSFYQKGQGYRTDSFSKALQEVQLPDDVGVIIDTLDKSPKGNFQTNLDNALQKLKEVLKGSF